MCENPEKGSDGTLSPSHRAEISVSLPSAPVTTCDLEACAEPATDAIWHPLQRENRTELCERHARRARAVAGDELKCPPANGRGERRQATRGARCRENGRGECGSPTCVTVPAMNASEPTHPEGENVSGESVDWETLGKELLRGELERHAYSLREDFQEAAHLVECGDLDAGELEELQRELRAASEWLDIVKGEM